MTLLAHSTVQVEMFAGISVCGFEACTCSQEFKFEVN